MRTRYSIGFAALLLAAAFCGTYASSHTPAANARVAPPAADVPDAAPEPVVEPMPNLFQSPYPDRTCVGVPSTSECCIWQVFKQGNGDRHAEFSTRWSCDNTTPIMRGQMSMKVTLNSPGPTCDPRATLIPNGSVLVAKGDLISRPDGFGDFTGTFEIIAPTGGTVLFKGCIETLDRVGTHRSCENCNPTSHYEGWMTGRGVGQLSSMSIRASIGGRGMLPTPNVNQHVTAIDINGMLLKCP